MFQEEARKRMLAGLKQGDVAPRVDQKTRTGDPLHGTALRARDEAAAMMNVGATTVAGRGRGYVPFEARVSANCPVIVR